ncbi:hypothetical protein MNBD_CHLOROFLEXI01-1153 [hydrothermal vent metagenome]|uniref:Uncharacterized protein n=1 Tax=hydrothermal vent metagenome TaxID=652676 RepID=A0A3B0VWK3_9ZZZZ
MMNNVQPVKTAWLIVAIFLSACVTVGNESPDGLLDNKIEVVDCSLVETVESETAVDTGFATAAQALNALAQENYLPGEPVIEAESENGFIWLLLDGDRQLGRINAVRNANGLWQISQASWCVEAASSSQDVQAIVKPLDCSLIEEAKLADIAQNSGYETPEQALDSLTFAQRPFGEVQSGVTYGEEGANYVRWLFSDDSNQTGSVTAAHAAWGLWVITGVQKCIE